MPSTFLPCRSVSPRPNAFASACMACSPRAPSMNSGSSPAPLLPNRPMAAAVRSAVSGIPARASEIAWNRSADDLPFSCSKDSPILANASLACFDPLPAATNTLSAFARALPMASMPTPARSPAYCRPAISSYAMPDRWASLDSTSIESAAAFAMPTNPAAAFCVTLTRLPNSWAPLIAVSVPRLPRIPATFFSRDARADSTRFVPATNPVVFASNTAEILDVPAMVYRPSICSRKIGIFRSSSSICASV